LDFDEEFTKFKATGVNKPFELPDGNVISIESYLEHLSLFQPSFVGSELPGIDNLVSKSIRLCDIGLRKDL
jgi:hypothetical protein